MSNTGFLCKFAKCVKLKWLFYGPEKVEQFCFSVHVQYPFSIHVKTDISWSIVFINEILGRNAERYGKSCIKQHWKQLIMCLSSVSTPQPLCRMWPCCCWYLVIHFLFEMSPSGFTSCWTALISQYSKWVILCFSLSQLQGLCLYSKMENSKHPVPLLQALLNATKLLLVSAMDVWFYKDCAEFLHIQFTSN